MGLNTTRLRVFTLFVSLWPALAPVPCGPELTILLQVGDYEQFVHLSQDIEHGATEDRACDIVNGKYEGMITLGCDEGELNATTEDCRPRHCPLYTSVSLKLGDVALALMPLEPVAHEGVEERLCRHVNPGFRGTFLIYCNYGVLTVNIEGCITQWSPMHSPPWSARSQHVVVGLSDGNVLLLGGLGVTGPLREVWELTPELEGGTWVKAQTPPWTGRFGIATAWQAPCASFMSADNCPERCAWEVDCKAVDEEGEQVTVFGGNDGLNRNDVWRWLRKPSRVDIPLGDGHATRTDLRPCTMGRDINETDVVADCKPAQGVQGRRWFIPTALEPSTEVFLDLNGEAFVGDGVVVLAIQLDKCRHVFEFHHGKWVSRGCSVNEPSNPTCSNSSKRQAMGSPEQAGFEGERQSLRIVLNRERSPARLRFFVNGAELLPASELDKKGLSDAQLGVPVGDDAIVGGVNAASNRACNGTEAEGGDDSSEHAFDFDSVVGSCVVPPSGAEAYTTENGQLILTAFAALKVIEIVAWPNAKIEVTRLSLMAPPGHWQSLVDDAPWLPRSSHAALTLPHDGDVLLMGGLSSETKGLLNDVWRWSPIRCTLLPDLSAEQAVRYELECGRADACKRSLPWGQWTRLSNAPWAPRQGHAVLWTAGGVILVGGRTASSFMNDVWRWVSNGPLCSLSWQGNWKQLVAAASFAPRHGHSLLGFVPAGKQDVETVLVLGGFGGEPAPDELSRDSHTHPVQSWHDVWCGSFKLGQFSEWTELVPVGPFSARSQSGAVVTPTLGEYRLVLVGGYDESARQVSDQWLWSGENATANCKVEDV
eukprot:TRINITY_DN68019_c0_g1_i1.p1 TRINITY_DN68019_c0_g1~~TRINITY_DN68019_c0_g1_i1.p1  ORF type:complete len:822 (-),score=108.86 TRINITY_DN68019_c0_g1_i1:12-2477(-)